MSETSPEQLENLREWVATTLNCMVGPHGLEATPDTIDALTQVIECRAKEIAESRRKVWGHCGSCGGHEFSSVERCDGCGEEEITERLVGDPVKSAEAVDA